MVFLRILTNILLDDYANPFPLLLASVGIPKNNIIIMEEVDKFD